MIHGEWRAYGCNANHEAGRLVHISRQSSVHIQYTETTTETGPRNVAEASRHTFLHKSPIAPPIV